MTVQNTVPSDRCQVTGSGSQFWSAWTCPRFGTGRHVARSQSGVMPPHSQDSTGLVELAAQVGLTCRSAGAAKRGLSQSAAHGGIETHGATRNVFRGGALRVGTTCGPVPFVIRHSSLRRGFSLVELLITMTLLSLIVLALMAVFSSTQRAFRASVTQTDVLEGSRAAMDLISTDLRNLVPCDGHYNWTDGGVNFFSLDNNYPVYIYNVLNNVPLPSLGYWPLPQSLPGSSVQRTNLLNYFFILGRENMKWTGVGYVVDVTNNSPMYPLYRFYAETDVRNNPYLLFSNFVTEVYYSKWTNMSHVLDGVVHLTARAYDKNGAWLTNGYASYYGAASWKTNLPPNVFFYEPPSPLYPGEVGCYFFSNAVPAAVEFELGVMEDRTMQRASSLPNDLPLAPPQDRRTLYLQGQSGHVHLFRQRVAIPNVDPSAYP
jgi:prepilin-type N-terminal cleavage/methylation domain-containing protein